MRANRPQDAASHPRRHRFGAAAVRVLSVTAVAATACAMMAGAASAATAAPAAGTPTTTAITNANPSTIKVGQSFTFDVSVTAGGDAVTTGSVGVAPNDATLPAAYSCTAAVTGEEWTCTVTPTEYGVVDYTATYTTDGTHAGSASDGLFALAVQNVTSTTVSASTGKAGPVTLSAAVNAMGADIVGGAGSLAFYNGLKVISGCAAVPLTAFNTTTHNNVGTCKTRLGAGTYTINVKYSGDEVNEASAGTRSLTLTKRASATGASASPNPAVVRKAVRFSATVTGLGGTPTGTVTFTWKGAKVCSGRLSHGAMHCFAKSTKAGRYVMKATYSGDSIHKSSSRLIVVIVKK